MGRDFDYDIITDLSSEKYWLVLLNVDLPVNQENISKLWNNAAKIVCLDGALNRFKNFITANAANREKILRGPDFIIGDTDSIDPDSIDWLNRTFGESSYEIEIVTGQDTTDFNKSLQFINTRTPAVYPDLNFVIALNCFRGRLDHILDILNTAHQFTKNSRFNIQLMDESSMARVMTKKCVLIEYATSNFEGHSCGLLPLFGPVRLDTRGLHWEIQNRTLEFSGLISTSNLITRPSVRIINNSNPDPDSEDVTPYIWTHEL